MGVCNMCGNRCSMCVSSNGDRCSGNSMVCDGNGLGNLNGVGFGNMFLNNDFSLNGDGDSNGDLDGVFVNLKLGFDSGHLGSDDRVGPDGSLDFGDGNSISRCGSI